VKSRGSCLFEHSLERMPSNGLSWTFIVTYKEGSDLVSDEYTGVFRTNVWHRAVMQPL
jgi:hypothetical protein